MTNFLTVREAAKKAGRSTSFIRRIIYPILEQADHPDRGDVEPSPEHVQELRMKGVNFGWSISEELLQRKWLLGKRPRARLSRQLRQQGRTPLREN
jgi:hypothetical protein